MNKREIALPGTTASPAFPHSNLYSFRMIVHHRIRLRGRLKHTSTMIGLPVDCVSQTYVRGGRTLLLFTAILIVVMPWTEYFWHFDGFLHGGQDFELGILSLLTIFSLVLVLLQQRRQSVALLLIVRRWLSNIFEDPGPRAVANTQSLRMYSDIAAPSSCARCQYNFPLRV